MRTLTVTIDVEPDATFGSWATSNPITFNGVFEGIKRIENICAYFNVPVTYFIQPVVLFNDNCIEYFKSISGEMATHLHGEYIKPNPRFPGPDFSGCDPSDRQKDYTRHVEMSKMSNITDLFADKFGYPPLSFRAGRFGGGKNTFRCLKKLGYSHDSGIVPGHKNFKNIKKHIPYKQDGIIEVPVTLIRNKWLRPTPGYSGKKVLKSILKAYTVKETNVCCMFHNVEVVPAINPYCDTEHDCSKMLDTFKFILEQALEMGYKPITIKEVTL